MPGTLVGFWTPLYAGTIDVAGWHLRFLTNRARHGASSTARAVELRVQMQDLATCGWRSRIRAFLAADLSQDPSEELEVAGAG